MIEKQVLRAVQKKVTLKPRKNTYKGFLFNHQQLLVKLLNRFL